jgi:trk system potassium uptake protein TrkA
MKEFVVIGLGNFGATVARELARQKCRVTAIDQDEHRVQDLQDLGHIAAVADATDRRFLENLDVAQFNAFIVSTGVDSHASILITLHLKELGAQQIIVKANSADHSKILIKVGADDAIIPEEQMAGRLAHSLAQANLVDYLPLSTDHFVAELVPPDTFVGKTLQAIGLRSKFNLQVIATKHSRTGEYTYAPGGEYVIGEHDLLVILGKEEDIERLRP